jgi:DNA-binding NarL/FixJ family response regulator
MSKLKKIKIIIIEDDMYYAQILSKHIMNHLTSEESGLEYDIKTYRSAEDCLNNLEKDTDIVIMDYYLENDYGDIPFPGLDLLQAINAYCFNTKTVVMSADDNKELPLELFRNGIYEFIVKDKNATEKLSETLRRMIGDRILEYYLAMQPGKNYKR